MWARVSKERKKKEHSCAGDGLRVDASSLPGTVSRGNDLPTAGGQFLRVGNDGRAARREGVSGLCFLFLLPSLEMTTGAAGLSPPPWSQGSHWALCLRLGLPQWGDSGRCREFPGLTNTLNEF